MQFKIDGTMNSPSYQYRVGHHRKTLSLERFYISADLELNVRIMLRQDTVWDLLQSGRDLVLFMARRTAYAHGHSFFPLHIILSPLAKHFHFHIQCLYSTKWYLIDMALWSLNCKRCIKKSKLNQK